MDARLAKTKGVPYRFILPMDPIYMYVEKHVPMQEHTSKPHANPVRARPSVIGDDNPILIIGELDMMLHCGTIRHDRRRARHQRRGIDR